MSKSAQKLVFDPLVPMCILDHYTRREYELSGETVAREATEVYGALLGALVGGVLEVRSCVPVKHNAFTKEFSFDMSFQAHMVELHRKIYTKDRLLGWYTNHHNPIISRALHKKYQALVKVGPTVNLVLDTSLANGTLNPKCFIMTDLKLGEKTVPDCFKEIPFQWKCHSPVEKVALDTMITNRHILLKPLIDGLPEVQTDELQSCQKRPTRPGTFAASTTPGDRPPFENVHKHLLQIQAVLKNALGYVNSVSEGKEKANPAIARELLNVLQSVPPVAPEAFDKLYNSTTQDMLMVNYLAKLTQTQVHLMERLHVYVPDVKPRHGDFADERQ
eukprot:TRINITY_DN7269_c0_g2_i1.p1 TRINITY_DN7269_c0_g2~~TRINITY_DN7269_c0_g2_i1.p1  ORF type:complete len:332 (+),score=69.32 TRINITY_DN7269_c0_g2_i1:62-1057(+)